MLFIGTLGLLQNEELAKLFELPSQTDALDQINDFAKLVCDLGPGSPNTEAYFQQVNHS